MSTLCRAGPPQQHNSWSPLPCGGIPALPGIPPEVAPPNSVTPRHLNNLLLPQVTTTGNSLRGPRNCGTDLLDASGGRKFRRIVVVGPLCPRATPEFLPRLSTAFRRRPRVPRFTRRRGSGTYVLRIVVRLATTRQRRTQIFLRESRFFSFPSTKCPTLLRWSVVLEEEKASSTMVVLHYCLHRSPASSWVGSVRRWPSSSSSKCGDTVSWAGCLVRGEL